MRHGVVGPARLQCASPGHHRLASAGLDYTVAMPAPVRGVRCSAGPGVSEASGRTQINGPSDDIGGKDLGKL